MKRTSLAIFALLIVVLAGCSKPSPSPSPAASLTENNNLGTIEVSSGKPNSYTLTDGRSCTILATNSTDGNATLATTVIEADGSKKTLVFGAPIDGHAYTFGFDAHTVITVALHK